ncbi:hypothetical protein NQ314_009120 [Rhamnusium bicolor]|uniref:Xylose isomerase-like TIM barrel domain-containing protein n=1 Tax=Rhamnusium bicolor TaxID=1586634 RepID=A0AAV8Y2D2_9CUCU|nr:hypothetical protein NQ314_009120 [Rhamnusium bicolor]
MLHSRLFNITASIDWKMSKFCANLAFLFPENSLLEKYKVAKDAGFKAVETGFPFGITKQQVVDAKNASGIQQILINIYTGDVTKGELGFAAIPGRENEFKRSIETTIDYAKALGARNPNLKLMLDIFHLQLIQGNISNSIKELSEYIGHVQIAQAPNRNEPNSFGEINYKYVLETLQKEGYNDWIGLEYKPLGDTKDGLKWIEELGYNL